MGALFWLYCGGLKWAHLHSRRSCARLPTTAQLASYAPRVLARGGGALVTLSQASRDLASSLLPHEIDGVPVIHLPWPDVVEVLTAVRSAERGQRRLWLDQFQTYLTKVIHVRPPADSWTYCVSVSNGRPAGGGRWTFQEYVTHELHYFHPYGVSGWPLEPPNFVAFRWQGAVQRIHRVTKADVVPRLVDRWPDIPTIADTVRPHAVYQLGPRIPPHEPIPSGAQYRASRLGVLLDQLQTSPTLAHAIGPDQADDRADVMRRRPRPLR